MSTDYICPVCGNKDTRYIGYKNGKPYCRKCISFRGEEVVDKYQYPKNAYYNLSYSLTKDQLQLADKLISNYKNSINSFVHAVCGSGKTEIVLKVISYAIQCGDKIAFAVPRRDVAIELHERFAGIFKKNKIVLVYGGHHNQLTGDLVCLTTHQLFRYNNYFDLLIMDEVDAFPYKGSDILYDFFKRAIKGRYILMSATANPQMLEMFKKDNSEILELYSRFHEHPLPVPELIEGNIIKITYILIQSLRRFIKENRQVFIFTPTIEMCENLNLFLKIFFKNGMCVHSKRKDRSEIINDFKNGKYKFLVTTAVLERGVTVKDLQVIVYRADHNIYDRYSLIQIAGRVGRKLDAPEGEVIFLGKKDTIEIRECIREIETANDHL